MRLTDFQNKLIDHEMRIVDRAYKDEKDKRAGAIAALVTCRGKSIEELKGLLIGASTALVHAQQNGHPKYWEIAMFHMEVEEVCDVISALCKAQGWEPIIDTPSKSAYNTMMALVAGTADMVFEKKATVPKILHS